MDKLVIHVPGESDREIALKPGVNRFGRSSETDFPVNHPSVSNFHCEMTGDDGAWTVKDLGSTNGTTLDGAPVLESPMQAGQTLRVGEVEMVLSSDEEPRPVPSVPVAVPIPRRIPASPAAAAPQVRKVKRAARPVRSFYAGIPNAFLFPFRRHGLILLGSGAVFFVLLHFASLFIGLVSLGIACFSSGYLFAFLKSVAASAAVGDDDIPDWPDFDGLCFGSFLEALALVLLCLAPDYLYRHIVDDPQDWLHLVLVGCGLAYMPMALLCVAIYESAAAINPMLVLASIARVPLEYATACAVLGPLVFGVTAADRWLRANAQLWGLTSVLTELFFLYMLTVVARLMGQLYHSAEKRLNWKFGGT